MLAINSEKLDIQEFIGKDINNRIPLPIIAGPCSAESPEQLLVIASALYQCGIRVFRAGVWKPRTLPGQFEGYGSVALKWLNDLKRLLPDIKICTEVATPQHLELCLASGIDMVWIGARTSSNPFMMQELAENMRGVKNLTVMVKNPVSPDLSLWIGAIKRIANVGVKKIAAIHRGFSSYRSSIYRNTPHWSLALEFRSEMPEVPIIGDPSHIAGKRSLVPELCQQFHRLSYDALMIEVHNTPSKALSDAAQQLSIEEFHFLLQSLKTNDHGDTKHLLVPIREKIDQIDHTILELLSERMRLSQNIAEIKNSNNINIIQPDRFSKMLKDRLQYAEALHLKKDFTKHLVEVMHEESISIQNGVVRKVSKDRKELF